ncbi:unnamed protein product [Periconia digitata]|uniref:Uncharacterized protein n=1 Tax=Periconia digitata TaxID=1303443 RepID=A0A9W4XXZ5_9PLEO|nr:unnamed protein product [Periconia digitata]
MPTQANFVRTPTQPNETRQYNHLREMIIYNAPVLYGASPRVLHHGYSVITTRLTATIGNEHQAALVAFSGPNGSVQGILLCKSEPKASPMDAMEDLLASMERELGGMLSQAISGEKIPYKTDQNFQKQSEVFMREAKPVHSKLAFLQRYAAPIARRLSLAPSVRSTPDLNQMIPNRPPRNLSNIALNGDTVNPFRNKLYRKPAPPIQDGYKAYEPPSLPSQLEEYEAYRKPAPPIQDRYKAYKPPSSQPEGYTAYRKPAPPIQDGYKAYKPPSLPSQLEEYEAYRKRTLY